MKNLFCFLIIFISLCPTACLHKNKKSKSTNNIEKGDTIIYLKTNPLDLKTANKGNMNAIVCLDSSVIFSTENLVILGNNGIDTNYMNLKRFNSDNEIVNIQYNVHYLPNFKSYKVAIMYDDNSDVPIYLLAIIHENQIHENESLDITPHWDTYDDSGEKQIEIYSDYTIKINTDEKVNGKNKKYTKYYRINDQGKFYEVKE